MFDAISRIVPPTLLFGILLYAGLCSVFLQPLVETRLEAKIYGPQCEAGVVQANATIRSEQQQDQASKRRLIEAYKQLMGPLADLPGVGDVTDIVADTAQSQLPDIEVPQRIDITTPCGCAVGAAFDAVKIPMLLHVMTARFYQPSAVKSLPQSIANIAASGQCGRI